MPRQSKLSTEFVELVPPELEDGVLYVSMEHSCVIHRCCCGCGEKVVTPLSPGEWQLSYDGLAISLYPSIGNSRFPCRSHYWIKQGRVDWAPTLSEDETEVAWRMDRATRDARRASPNARESRPPTVASKKSGLFRRLWYGLIGSS
jgi:hypothetical protein